MRAPSPAPYVGLRPFEFDEAALFYGRGEHIAEMVRTLRKHRFLAVVGSSGSGKSSLVRAGLLPAIAAGFLTGGEEFDWRFVISHPGLSPYENLAQSLLLNLLPDSASGRAPDPKLRTFRVDTLKSGPRGLVQTVTDSLLPEKTRLVILIDQFEEIFRLLDRAGTAQPAAAASTAEQRNTILAFVDMLLTTVEARHPQIDVVLTMRSEYLGECEAFLGLSSAISRSEFLTPRMKREQIQDVIERPLAAAGGHIQPQVVTTLLNALGTAQDQLPRVEHILLRMWHRADDAAQKEKKADAPLQLTLDDYQKSGGFESALDQHATQLYDQLGDGLASSPPTEKQRVTRWLFRSLGTYTPQGTLVRRICTLGEVVAIAGTTNQIVREVVEHFRQPGCNFLVATPEQSLDDDTSLDISHEALLRQWKTCLIWQEEERKDATELRDLCRRSQVFQENPIRVLSKEDLETFKRWKSAKTESWSRRYVSKDEWQALDKLFTASELSLKLADRYKRAYAKVALAFIVVGMLIAIIGLIGAWWQMQKAEKLGENATKRMTQSLQRVVGHAATLRDIGDEEMAALWDIAELSMENEPVREALLNYWFDDSTQFSRGTKIAGDGIGTAMGLSLKLNHHAAIKARDFAGVLVSQGSGEWNESEILEENWRFLARFLNSNDLDVLLSALVDKLEKGTAPDTAVEDLSVVSRLLIARPHDEAGPSKTSLTRAAAQLVRALKNRKGGGESVQALADMAAKLDAATAASLARELTDALENLLAANTADHDVAEIAKALAILLTQLDAPASAPLAKRGTEALVRELLGKNNRPRYQLLLMLGHLTEKLDAATAAVQGELLLKELENLQEKDMRHFVIANALTILLLKTDSSAAPLVQRAADQLIAVLASSQPESNSLSSRMQLVERLHGLLSRLDHAAAAAAALRTVEPVIKMLEQSPSSSPFLPPPPPGYSSPYAPAYPSYASDPYAVSDPGDELAPPSVYSSHSVAALVGLVVKLDDASSARLAEQQVRVLEDPQSNNPSFGPIFYAYVFPGLASKLDTATAEKLAKQFLESKLPMDRSRAKALLSLMPRLEAMPTASLAQSAAEKLVQRGESSESNSQSFRYSLMKMLPDLLTKLSDSDAAPLALGAAAQMVKSAQNWQMGDGGYSPQSARICLLLTRLTEKMDATAIASLAEPLVYSLEAAPLTEASRISRVAQVLSCLDASLDVPHRQSNHRRLLTVLMGNLLGGGRDKKAESLAQELSAVFCHSAYVLTPQEKQVLLQYALEFRLNDSVPELYNQYGPAIEDEDRRITREALAELDVPVLANMLKWPECRGEARKLVLQTLEQKTGREFHGDIWQFVTFAATNCTPGVDLDGPARRITFEEMLKAVSKPLNLSAAKP